MAGDDQAPDLARCWQKKLACCSRDSSATAYLVPGYGYRNGLCRSSPSNDPEGRFISFRKSDAHCFAVAPQPLSPNSRAVSPLHSRQDEAAHGHDA